MFPSIKRNFEEREAWIKLLKRVTADNKKWKPFGNERVCIEHFVDGIPTTENPNPTLKLGLELKQTKPRRTLFWEPFTKKLKKLPESSATTLSLPIIQPLLYHFQHLCLHHSHHHYHVQTFFHQYQSIAIVQETILLNMNHAVTTMF